MNNEKYSQNDVLQMQSMQQLQTYGSQMKQYYNYNISQSEIIKDYADCKQEEYGDQNKMHSMIADEFICRQPYDEDDEDELDDDILVTSREFGHIARNDSLEIEVSNLKTKISSINEDNKKLLRECSMIDKELNEVRLKAVEWGDEYQSAQRKYQELRRKYQTQNQSLNKYKQQNNILQQQFIETQKQTHFKCNQQIQSHSNEIGSLKKQLIDKDKQIKKQQTYIDQYCEEQKLERSHYQMSSRCAAMNATIKIFKKYFSDIPPEFMEPSQNSCFCIKCHEQRRDKLVYFRGKPAKKYVLPIGWIKLGLKVNDGKCILNHVWATWHCAYHGCSVETAKIIFKSGLRLIKPGDQTITGNKLKIPSGHYQKGFSRFNEYTKINEMFEPRNIFVSPSIKYASNSIYAKEHVADKGDRIKVVFQLRIRPNSYKIGQETIGATKKGMIIDSEFNNNELEWYTKENLGIVLHGLLIKIDQNN